MSGRTIIEYMDNPMGVGSSVMPSKHLILEDYAKRFAKLNSGREITPVIYYDKSEDEYYFHFMIPSESNDQGNTYDVVLKFSPRKDGKTNALSMYDMQMFSNSPSFVYTYAYSYKVKKLLIEFLADNKYDENVLSKAPNIRNPQQTMSYEKSTTFAMMAMLQEGKYLNKLIVDPMTIPFTEKKLLDAIRNDEKVKTQNLREQRRVKREIQEVKKKEEQSFLKRKRREHKSPAPGARAKLRATTSSSGLKPTRQSSTRQKLRPVKSNVKRK